MTAARSESRPRPTLRSVASTEIDAEPTALGTDVAASAAHRAARVHQSTSSHLCLTPGEPDDGHLQVS